MSRWVEAVPKKDLAMIHHACRVFAKYPGLKDEDKQETTRVADLVWDEIARRVAVGGDPEPKCYCGSLEWTVNHYGRLTHKHGCPARTDPFCQSHREGCPVGGDPE